MLTPAEHGMRGAIREAEMLLRKNPMLGCQGKLRTRPIRKIHESTMVPKYGPILKAKWMFW